MSVLPEQSHSMELECKPDFDMAMQRVNAWYEGEMIDRPPVRFSEHNSSFYQVQAEAGRSWGSLKERWFDAEYQVDLFLEMIAGRQFHGETFPVFSPNLGPGVYAAFHGSQLIFGEVTSWCEPLIHDWDDLTLLRFDPQNEYFRKIEELTCIALEKCPGRFMVGYTDLHGSLDCAADWLNRQELCMEMVMNPEKIHQMVQIADRNFLYTFDYFDALLKKHGQISVTWLGVPSFGKMHIPSCDFATMISQEMFNDFYLPSLQREVKAMTHNVFHLDGKGVAQHLDSILSIPEINAIQWVQGVGEDEPIMQWLPLIRKIQAAGKSVIIDLKLNELEEFIANMNPRGLYLCLAADSEIQPEIIKRLERW